MASTNAERIPLLAEVVVDNADDDDSLFSLLEDATLAVGPAVNAATRA